MIGLKKLIDISQKFVKKEINIEEYQRKLEQVIVPEELSRDFEKIISQAVNRLEEIRFTSKVENQYNYALEVADEVIKKTEKYL